MKTAMAVLLVALVAPLQSPQPAAWKDPSSHASRLITAGQDVRLEVLDWGGAGRPLVLLAGGGDTAHVFDDFAPTYPEAELRHKRATTPDGRVDQRNAPQRTSGEIDGRQSLRVLVE
jgi:hypothetical protein